MEIGVQQLGKSLMALNNRFAVISNNIANSATDRYKADTLTVQSFSDYYIQEQYKAGKENMLNQTTRTDFTQGELLPSSSSDDLALEGSGFFRVQYNNAVYYTRGGNFRANTEGYLSDAIGGQLLDAQGNRIYVGDQDYTIEANGDLYIQDELSAQVSVVDFANYNGLTKTAAGYYQAAGAPQMQAEAQVKQGYAEQSNVSLTSEYVKMMELNRLFETNQVVIQILDEIQGKTVNSIALF